MEVTGLVAEAVTAGAELDNAAPPEAPPDAPDEVAQPETAEGDDAPESEAAAEPETEVSDPLDGLDDAAVKEHARVKAIIASERESMRRTTEAETERRIQAARYDWAVSGRAFAQINQAIEQGEVEQAQDALQKAFDARDWGAVRQVETVARQLYAEAGVDLSGEDERALSHARDIEEFTRSLARISGKALEPELRKKWDAEQKAKEKSTKKIAAVREAERVSANGGQPTTGVSGAASGREPTWDEVQKWDAEKIKANPGVLAKFGVG